ncbi:MAG: HD domain-containing protein [Deltaproteobacteria bacterium]|nr:HD domain-containing protein [Deltaproteobacteria bacterium]
MKKYKDVPGHNSNRPDLDRIRFSLESEETERLSPHATLSRDAQRRVVDSKEKADYRQSFSQDVDRILHALAYTRYIDKTQVFSLIQNDHLTHRVLHVQLVSKIARTIGRFLSLNEDLIEAIALGHDIGHTPFGHDGERILSKLCRDSGIGCFHHNVQSVQFLDRVERKGNGWNLCLQTLDGILTHDGEIHNQSLTPEREKTFETLFQEMETKKKNSDTELIPMTLEGCVVRMADTIAYIGRDLEDAIRVKMIQRSNIPEGITSVLGNTNGTIVFHLVTDVIQTSFKKPHIAFSPTVSTALKDLKTFNLNKIYLNPILKTHLDNISNLFERLFNRYIENLQNDNRTSVIFTHFLADMSHEYLDGHNHAEIVRDFIAGMTDRYFIQQCPEALRPQIVSIG